MISGRYISKKGEVFYYSGEHWYREIKVIKRDSSLVFHREIPQAGYVPHDPQNPQSGRLFILEKKGLKKRAKALADLELIVNPEGA